MKKALIYLLFALLPLAATGSGPDGLAPSGNAARAPDIKPQRGDSTAIPIHRNRFSSLLERLMLGSDKGTERDTASSIVGNARDCIHLSQREASFPREGGSVVVTTRGSDWWFCSVTVDGTSYPCDNVEDLLDHHTCDTYGWLTVSVSKDNAWADREITLTATPNDTGRPRSFLIELQADNYFDRISGTQE